MEAINKGFIGHELTKIHFTVLNTKLLFYITRTKMADTIAIESSAFNKLDFA